MCNPAFIFLKKTPAGFTLLEICVAASLSSTIILLLLIFYSTCLKFYFLVNELSQDLENGRYACFFMRKQLSHVFSVRGLQKDTHDILEVTSILNNQLIKTRYFINKISYTPSPLRKPLALFMKEEGKPSIEVASGIYDMKIRYGIKCPTSDNVCGYLQALEVTNWAEVVSLKITVFSNIGSVIKKWRMYIAIKKNE